MSPSTAESRRDLYARDGSRTVGGWVSDADFALFARLETFQRERGIEGHFCEIGVYRGKRFIFFCLSLRPGEKAVAVDIFAEDPATGGVADFEPEFRANVARHGPPELDLRIVRRDSSTLSAAELLAVSGGRFRIFSVDGDHHAAPMAGDLHLAAQTVSDGGLVIVDDYFNEQWPGVSEGTLGYLQSEQGVRSRLVPFAIFSTKVFLTHEGHADDYLSHVRSGVGPYQIVETPFLGRTVATVRFPPAPTLSMRLADTALWRAIRGTPVGKAVRRIRSVGR